MRNTTPTAKKATATTRTPLDMDISALLRAAELLENAASELSNMEADPKAAEELEQALRHNRQIWSVFMGDMRRPGSQMKDDIRKNVPSLGAQVLHQTSHLEAEKSAESVQKLVDVNRSLASDLQRSKVA